MMVMSCVVVGGSIGVVVAANLQICISQLLFAPER